MSTTPAGLLWAALIRLGEKAAWTFVEVFLTTYAMATVIEATTLQAAAAGGIAAALTALVNGFPEAPAGLPFGVDVFYRAARTLGASVLTVAAAVPVFDWSVDLWHGAVLAGVPAVAAVLKGAIASRFGADTPATLPVSVELAAAPARMG